MLKRFREWSLKVLGIVVTTIVTTLVTSWFTSLKEGKPLTGMDKISGLSHALIHSSIPNWIFAIVLAVALSALYYSHLHRPRKRKQDLVHFVQDIDGCGWTETSEENEMALVVNGVFTYDSQSGLIVFKCHLKGSKPTADLLAVVENPNGHDVTVREIYLRGGSAQRANLDLRLTPMLGIPGKPLRGTLVFVDKLNRLFPIVEPIELPYIGKAKL
jgi:hypothetical protein